MDTLREIGADRWYFDHLGLCGTCLYRERGICTNNEVERGGDLVEDGETCDGWVQWIFDCS